MEGQNNPQAMNFGGSGTSVGSGWDKNKGKGMVLELNNQNEYNQAIQAHPACVIDVFADWCGPCQAIKPFFSTLPAQYPNIRFFKVVS
jgi:thiol-disulfide isomerase/thioredoxin